MATRDLVKGGNWVVVDNEAIVGRRQRTWRGWGGLSQTEKSINKTLAEAEVNIINVGVYSQNKKLSRRKNPPSVAAYELT